MRSGSLLLVGVVSCLFWACQAPNALREGVSPDGEPVRIEVAEETAEAVADTAVAQRMATYRARREASDRSAEIESGGANQPAGNVALERLDEPGDGEVEDEGEPPVPATEVADRLATHRRHPASLRMVSAEDLGITNLANTAAFDPFEERGCPPEGTASTPKTIKQNRLKNRITKPHASDIDPDVTFDALRAPSQDDHGRWSTAVAGTIEGFCRLAKGTGAETCNCGKTAKALTDTHFEIVSGPNDQGQPVIAEITPVWRQIHAHFGQEDWSSSALHAKYEGHKVRITGWLFFDESHVHEADNTDPGDTTGKANWRATCWEIHPITRIEVVQ